MPNKIKHHGEDFNGYPLTGLPVPSADTDAATKRFVLDNAGGSPIASNVSYTPITGFPTDPNNPADTVQKAINNLFTLANSGKSAIAGAIGSPAASTDTFGTLAGYVTTAKTAIDAFVDKAEGTTDGTETLAQLTNKLNDVRIFEQRLNLKKAAGSTTTIQLASPFPSVDKVVCTPCVRVNDTATTSVYAAFNNGDRNDFNENEYIAFDGNARLKNNYSYSPSVTGSISEYTINASQFEDFKELSLSGTTLNLVARPKPQVLVANNNIPLDNVIDISTVTRTLGAGSVGTQYWVASFDSGTRWFGNFTNAVGGWVQVDITNVNDFANKATSATTIALDVITELRERAENNPLTVKFAYLLQDASYTQKNLIDKLEMGLVMSGNFVPYGNAGGSYVTSAPFTYDAGLGRITVNHPVTDAYLINYIDKASAVT